MYLLGLMPFGFALSLSAFYIHATNILGYFPRYNQPDPKELDIYICYEPVISLAGNLWICSVPIWLFLIAGYLIISRKNINWTPFVFSLIGQCCAILLFLSGIMEWFAD